MASRSKRSCVNHPDVFCYICGEYTFKENRKPVSDFVRRSYLTYFGVHLGNQDKSWAPHFWTVGKRKCLKFGVPMVWREPRNHHDDCYFCLVNIKGINRNNRQKWPYPDLDSANRPVLHSEQIPIPSFSSLPSLPEDDAALPTFDEIQCMSSENDSDFEADLSSPQRFNQQELNDLIRDLNLSKESSELLASRLNEKNLLQPDTNITFYRKRDKDLPELGKILLKRLLQKMGLSEYTPDEWRLFIDSSRRSLKCVLLHNGNKYGSIPIGHSTSMKEEYESISLVLKKIKYEEHQWVICVDLKMVNFLLGQQSGYTKYPCFLCLWDSRAKDQHWVNRNWPLRNVMTQGKQNVINEPLVARDKIIFPPLHIKLGLMKQFVKALNRDGLCFGYLIHKFPGISTEKLKAGIFDGPQIRQLIKDPQFTASMNEIESNAWCSFVTVVQNFLGNHKAKNYIELVENMLSNFNILGCNMSIKVHYLYSHLDRFPENLGDLSEEQGERFHQDIKTMEDRYQGRWGSHMMADYCWSLQRDCPNNYHARKSYKRKFLNDM
ncbi:hypothetical protein RI129_000709 [Pyrocoelia pectoralis]|uniref:Uncharacterized protein n=1 Tax=Pyrocoelia pectoralis TaxID=417401 RepID=A0AAN7VKX3_9COLE